MGITGLLPALKSIQTTRHLSEFGGKTVAVDAYVWLHKGIYGCATDLATGKSTTRYVEYAMHRVRMLRHHKIEPYVVFDGGPLPAKKGTESERRKRRKENLMKGKMLAAQGKSSQARDCFLKCVDVTPQMAFQLIKALRVEGVPYVVAPYEADAQLAYLERIGLVDAIITEDSDLLVFGCQNVLFKMDNQAATVVAISRTDFGSVSTSDISLVGWTDAQFRAMAILSGCDYLPSIPGIGLKRACGLLRKWKTAEQVVKAITLEGKKTVPADYINKFKLAEKCFKHQRVYCPLEEKLVHMTPVDSDWTQEFDDYCGGELEPDVAKKLALGDLDPAELVPMIDINPGFKPQPLTNQVSTANTTASKKGKGKAAEISGKSKATGGILNFFGPNPIIPSRPSTAPVPSKQRTQNLVGKASGKRTLVEIADQDHASRKKLKAGPRHSTPALGQSKFFAAREGAEHETEANVRRRHSIDSSCSQPGPSHLVYPQDKENMAPGGWQQIEDEEGHSDVSICAQKQVHSEPDGDLDLEIPPNIEQEDGYISPMAPSSPDIHEQNLPSPHLYRFGTPDDDIGESVSSPASVNKHRRSYRRSCSPRAKATPHSDEDCVPTPMTAKIIQRRSVSLGAGKVLVNDTPAPLARSYALKDITTSTTTAAVRSAVQRGPDLRDPFGGPEFGEIDDDGLLGGERENAQDSGSATPPSPSPITPASAKDEKVTSAAVIDVDEYDLYDEEEMAARDAKERTRIVAEGWKNKWALGPSSSQGQQKFVVASGGDVKGKAKAKGKKKRSLSPVQLKRSNTNVTPAGRHSFAKQPKSAFQPGRGAAKTPNTTFFQPRKMARPRSPIVIDDLSDEEDEITMLSSPAAVKSAGVGRSANRGGSTLFDRFKYS